MKDEKRCLEPKVGVKVLSYDLLEGEEKSEVDRHLEACVACKDLFEQTFGDEGALRDLEYRAFRLSQRQPVAVHDWLARRLAALWLPFLAVVVGISVLLLYLARRPPETGRVRVVRLATMRGATLDSLTSLPLPRISPAPTSVIIRTDRDAIALLYETGDGTMRRLVPGGDAVVPELDAEGTHELALPELETAGARILLVLAPATAPRVLAEWDRAVMERLGGVPEGGERRGWPAGVSPTLRWIR